MDLYATIEGLFATRGRALYFGEAVSEAEHALQSAALARADGAGDTLVVAALLHDVGHLLHGLGEDLAERGLDGRHEEVGHAWLSDYFGPAVAEPVRLHVAAKRYLCAVEPAYLTGLSPASRQSLGLQGGPFADGGRSVRSPRTPIPGPSSRRTRRARRRTARRSPRRRT